MSENAAQPESGEGRGVIAAPSGGRSVRRRRRATVAGVAALLLGVTGATTAAAAPGMTTRAAAAVGDWRLPWSTSTSGSDTTTAGGTSGYGYGDRYGYGDSSGGYGYPGGYGGGSSGGSTGSTSSGTATAVSTTATAAQSAGVVLIDTVLPYQDAEAAGTGMVLTTTGRVLTNYHVVEGAGTITVTVATTGRTYTATVVGSDPSADVAVLQLQNASGLTTITPDDDVLASGDTVTAIGNAGGTGTLTAATGTVSSLTSTVTTAAESSVASETLTSMIQTTADVVAGDSGGPLVDAEGEVVGIDTAASTGSVIDGYAIPIDRALAIVAQIDAGTASSTVRIGPAAFLGVGVVDAGTSGVSTPGYGLGYPRTQDPTASSGAVVQSVVDGSAAATAGLVAGDVITAVGGTTVDQASDVSAGLATNQPGDHVSLTWTDSAGTSHTATVTLGSSPVA